MPGRDYSQMAQQAAVLSGYSAAQQKLIATIGKDFLVKLAELERNYYAGLLTLERMRQIPERELEVLKTAKSDWLNTMFSGQVSATMVKNTYSVGEIYLKLDLPVEMMIGGTALLGQELMRKTFMLYTNDEKKCAQAVIAVNAMVAFGQIIMQAAYTASEAQALEKFLAVTGMSRALYDKLAQAYR
jgi:hypothetical protein